MKDSNVGKLIAIVVLLVQIGYIDCSRNVPHSHEGKLKPFRPGPIPSLTLLNEEISKLESGLPIIKKVRSDDDATNSEINICIQDIRAPREAVWYQILDFDNYPKKVSMLREHKKYAIKANSDGSTTVKTKHVIGVLPGYSFESYFDHTYYPEQSSVTWRLDYEKTSDFDDVSGYWHVQELAESYCRVYYTAEFKMKVAVPRRMFNDILKSALKQATGWVKRESELNPHERIPQEYHGGFGVAIPS